MPRFVEIDSGEKYVGVDAFRMTISQRPGANADSPHHIVIASGLNLKRNPDGSLSGGPGGTVYADAGAYGDAQLPGWPYNHAAYVSPYDLSGTSVPRLRFKKEHVPGQISALLPPESEKKETIAPMARLALLDLVISCSRERETDFPVVNFFNHHVLNYREDRLGGLAVRRQLVVMSGLGRFEIVQGDKPVTYVYRRQPLGGAMAFPVEHGWLGPRDQYDLLVERRKAFEQNKTERAKERHQAVAAGNTASSASTNAGEDRRAKQRV